MLEVDDSLPEARVVVCVDDLAARAAEAAMERGRFTSEQTAARRAQHLTQR
jgi:hypothetical protein